MTQIAWPLHARGRAARSEEKFQSRRHVRQRGQMGVHSKAMEGRKSVAESASLPERRLDVRDDDDKEEKHMGEDEDEEEEEEEREGPKRRANKNRPMEISSKKPVPRLREIIQASKPEVRDPRFESLCGDFDETRFKRSYGFIYDEALPGEATRLKKSMKKEKDPERKNQLHTQLKAIESQLRLEGARKKREAREEARQREEKEAIKAGKRPFFVTKAARRREELVQTYKELKASGKLEAFLAKRRKRNAAKEHVRVPRTRRGATAE